MLFKATVAAAKVAATLTNYPAYIDLSLMPSDFWSTVANGGGDIRCYSDEAMTTELAREVVSCDTATDTGELHVKIASLTTSTIIYIDVDGVRSDYAVTDTYGRNAVWTAYQMVQHQNSTTDSTANGFNVTNTSVTTVAGKLGDAGQYASGSNSDSDRGTSSPTYVNQMTIQSWFRITTFNDAGIITKEAVGYGGEVDYQITISAAGNRGAYFNTDNGATGIFAILTDYAVSLNTWYLQHYVIDRTNNLISGYIDGSVQSTASMGSRNVRNSNRNFGYGRIVGSQLQASMNGQIDEVRVRHDSISANWITTEYNNQSDVATFWTLESPTTNVTVNATTLSATFSLPAYTATPIRNVAPAATVLSATFSIPAYTVVPSTDITINAVTLSATFTIPAYVVEAGNITATPPTLSATFTLIAPTVVAEIYIEVIATTLSATFSIPAYSVSIEAEDTPDTLSATFTIPAYTVEVISNIDITPTVLSATFSFPTYVVGLSVDFSPATQTATFSIIAPTVVAARSVEVAAVVFTATFSLPTLAFFGGAWKVQAQVTDEWTPTSITE